MQQAAHCSALPCIAIVSHPQIVRSSQRAQMVVGVPGAHSSHVCTVLHYLPSCMLLLLEVRIHLACSLTQRPMLEPRGHGMSPPNVLLDFSCNLRLFVQVPLLSASLFDWPRQWGHVCSHGMQACLVVMVALAASLLELLLGPLPAGFFGSCTASRGMLCWTSGRFQAPARTAVEGQRPHSITVVRCTLAS